MQRIRNSFHRLYAWTTKWARHPRAEQALAGITAAEGVFFPIPPDPLLMAMVFTKPARWLRYSLITVTASVAGGIVGYAIGFALFESLGAWIISSLHLEAGYQTLSTNFQTNATLAVFTAALTPIPYKLITITAGATFVNFGVFVVASILGRGVRFFAVGFLARLLGARYKAQIEKYIDVISITLIVVLVALIVLTR